MFVANTLLWQQLTNWLGSGFKPLAAAYYTGNDVRFRRMRYLTWFLAAMFFANNAAAAVRACIIADLAGQEPMAVHALDANAGEPLCPPSDDAGPCLKHYAQTYRSDEHKFWVDFSPVAPAPVLAVLHVSFQAKPKQVVVASAPPIVGPPLTILFGNFRN